MRQDGGEGGDERGQRKNDNACAGKRAQNINARRDWRNLKDVANGEKKVPKEFINEKGNHITEACRKYIGPLIKGEAPITIGKDGLPVYVRLAKKWVEKKLPRYL